MKVEVSQQALLAGAVALAAMFAVPPARADAVSDAKAAVAKYAGPQTTWEGPTKAPKPEPGKKIVFLSGDEQNDISHLYGVYIKEAGREARVERHRHRRQRQPHLLAGRHESSDRLEAGRHRALCRRGKSARPDQGRRGAGNQVCRPPRRGPARAAARSQSVRQHPGGSARNRQGGGRLGDRRFGRQGPRRHPQPQRIRDRQGQIDRDQGRDREVPRLQGARLRQLARLRSGATSAPAHHELGSALRAADLRDFGRRQRLGFRRAGAALRRRQDQTRRS